MDQKWLDMYAQKRKTPEEAALMLEDGDGISVPTLNGHPRLISKATAERIKRDELKNIEFIIGLNLTVPELFSPEVLAKSHYCDGYMGSGAVRAAAKNNQADFLVWRFFENARLMVDVRGTNCVFMTAAPMDEHGYFSCALNCSHTYSLFQKRKKNGLPTKVFLEVNKNAPVCYGYNHFHISEVTALTEADWSLMELPAVPSDENDVAIAHYVAEQVPDGATIQLGIGGLPNAIGKQLASKKDLGCHSEMIVEAYLELYKAGALNNSKKSYMPGRCVATLAAGSRDLYKWIDRNPSIWIFGIDDCADPYVIAQNDNFMAINSVLECDLAGQCMSDSMGYSPYSGTGGQADFIQGAWQSKGGKAFLCLNSTFTDKEGKLQSKIRPTIQGWVGVSRNDVQYLVTEYGCVFLKGSTIRERIQKVVSIAHPEFREWLVGEAVKHGFIRSASDVNLKGMRTVI
jgi:acyl-CoA hydrolase